MVAVRMTMTAAMVMVNRMAIMEAMRITMIVAIILVVIKEAIRMTRVVE